MEVRLLGTVEVIDDGRVLSLGGPKQRALLVLLVLQAGRVVPTDRLIDLLWDGAPPPSARGTLQGYVSHLRSVLGQDRLQTHPAGYRLHADPAQVDAVRFEAALGRAKELQTTDPAAAVRELDAALALWRGPALGDLAAPTAVRAEAARLDERRITAVGDRLSARLELGADEEVVAELLPLVERHPLREHLWELLLLALYRSGRQGEALAAYRRACGLLRDELGIEPSAELRDLHARILAQDPSLERVAAPLRGYVLHECIGAGTFSAVYRATTPGSDHELALKVLAPVLIERPGAAMRFDAACAAVARLEHPHLVPIHAYWQDAGGAYVVMRLLPGGTLADRLAAGLDAGEAVQVVDQLGRALAALHRHGIAHGDLRPTNVLFDAEGNAYLSDAGLAATGTFREDADAFEALALRLLAPHHPSAEVAAALATSVDDVDVVLHAVHDALLRTPLSSGGPVPNPYRGLRPFTAADGEDFHGREALVADVGAQLTGDGPPVVALVGPSGCGLTSLLQAGILPAFRAGIGPAGPRWTVVQLDPRGDPFAPLRSALAGIAAQDDTAEPGCHLDDAALFDRVAASVVPPGGAGLLVVIDGFEGLFVDGSDQVRASLVASVARVAADPASRVRVVLTIRAHRYDLPLRDPAMAALLGGCTRIVAPLAPEELEQAITGPARRCGVAVEPALTAALVADVMHQPGALPLLQFTLTELFDRRDGGPLTLVTYRELGGLGGALAGRAEETYARLAPASQEVARSLLLRLVAVEHDGRAEGRAVPRNELDGVGIGVGAGSVDAVLDAFGGARLLTFDRDAATGVATVALAHDALLLRWGRLRGWVEAAADDLVLERRLRERAQEWLTSGRDTSALVTGGQLELFETWHERCGLAVTTEEVAYLAAALDLREQQRREAMRREVELRTLERTARARLRALVVTFALLGLLATGIAVVAALESRGVDTFLPGTPVEAPAFHGPEGPTGTGTQ